MTNQPSDFTIYRRHQVQAESGYSRSTLYALIAQGLWPKPVSLGARAVGWPAREVAEINEARISGATPENIKNLVRRLETARANRRNS